MFYHFGDVRKKTLEWPQIFFFLIIFTIYSPHTYAEIIYDNFDSDGGFHPQNNYVAAFTYDDEWIGLNRSIRMAVQFSVTGGDFSLESISVPIAFMGGASNDTLRVRLTDDYLGVPGSTLEILSENKNIWPNLTNPFTQVTW